MASGSTDFVAGHPDPLVALSDDANLGKVPPWKFEMTNNFDNMASYASVKSNLWPGAFAVARDRLVLG